MDKLTQFIIRLKRKGIDIKLITNFPWVYLISINGKTVLEKKHSEHGFVIAFLPIKFEDDIHFTNIKEIFEIIRKYKKLEYLDYIK